MGSVIALSILFVSPTWWLVPFVMVAVAPMVVMPRRDHWSSAATGTSVFCFFTGPPLSLLGCGWVVVRRRRADQEPVVLWCSGRRLVRRVDDRREGRAGVMPGDRWGNRAATGDGCGGLDRRRETGRGQCRQDTDCDTSTVASSVKSSHRVLPSLPRSTLRGRRSGVNGPARETRLTDQAVTGL
jgi:hypothetical protein